MLLLEFNPKILNGDKIIVRYKTVNSNEWVFLYLDIETLNLLLNNFGIIGCVTEINNRCIDNQRTGKTIELSYCGAQIHMFCGNNSHVDLRLLEQNY